MIYGVGVDLVEISRIKEILDKYYDRFLVKVYSSPEIEYCNDRAEPATHFAAKFAAKESFLKALGIGLYMGVNLTDVEVIHQLNGKPILRLHNSAKDMLIEIGISLINLSLSHTRTHACAVIILEK